MSFVQIESFRTDRIDELTGLAEEWAAATRGRRTVVADRIYRDRHDPRRYLVVNEFDSYDRAMVNSALPETDALTAKVHALVDDGVEFIDLDEVGGHDLRLELADTLRGDLEAATLTPAAYDTRVVLEGQWPDQLVRYTGLEGCRAALAAAGPIQAIDQWTVVTTRTGFVAEYAYRTAGPDSRLSVGVILATVKDGAIRRLLITCAGAWDAATEVRIHAAIDQDVAS